MVIAPGKIIGRRYKLKRKLGHGGMGEVYLAYDTHLATDRAIKFLSTIGTPRSQYTERFLREAQTAAQLGSHPNVAAVHDHFSNKELAYIVMEFIRGPSLEKILKEKTRLSIERTVSLMKGICAGVGAAHRKHCVHRDLDPKNVIVSNIDGRELVKVIDWGLVKIPDARTGASRTALTQTGIHVGKPAYWAPEHASQAGPQSDVYSLGIMMYEMLVGTRPFNGPDYLDQHKRAKVPAFPEDLRIPPRLESIVRKALAKSPTRRYCDANELSAALASAVNELSTERARKERQQEEEQRRKLESEIKRLQIELEEQRRRITGDSHPPLTDHATANSESGTSSIVQPTTEGESHPASAEPQNRKTAIERYLASEDPYKRAAAIAEVARSQPSDEAVKLIADAFDDSSSHVRNAAARALSRLKPVMLFDPALEGSSTERRRNIGKAIAGSGVANEALGKLVSDNREETYDALSILFVMAKAGEVKPLIKAIEEHGNDVVGRSVAKLLTLAGHAEIANVALPQDVSGVRPIQHTSEK